MNNQINLKIPVYQTLKDHPELLDLLVDMGFTPLANVTLRNTLAKAVSLEKGASILKIPLEELIQTLRWNGYSIEGDQDE